jgi:hypothetical protein
MIDRNCRAMMGMIVELARLAALRINICLKRARALSEGPKDEHFSDLTAVVSHCGTCLCSPRLEFQVAVERELQKQPL